MVQVRVWVRIMVWMIVLGKGLNNDYGSSKGLSKDYGLSDGFK